MHQADRKREKRANLEYQISTACPSQQAEKETLESSADSSLKGIAIKLLENGKNIL